MKYLCLVCSEARPEAAPEPGPDAAAVRARAFEAYRDFTDGLRAGGQLVGCNRLQPPETAITVRVRDGRMSTTDGPFAETKEQLGGYFLVEAHDLNEAIQIAARIPGARTGCVEVRPVAEDPETLAALGLAPAGAGG